jgi:hypothetical protein
MNLARRKRLLGTEDSVSPYFAADIQGIMTDLIPCWGETHDGRKKGAPKALVARITKLS